MPSTDRAALERFLLDLAHNQAAVGLSATAMQLAQPFFAIAESGSIRRPRPLSNACASQAIALAINRQVERVTLIPSSFTFTRGRGWMVGDLTLPVALRAEYFELVPEYVRDYAWNALWESLWAGLKGRLMDDSHWESVRPALFYLTCFSLLGDFDRVARLAPLVSLLPSANPLGETRDRQADWVVITA